MAIAKLCSISNNPFSILNYAILQTKASVPIDQRAKIITLNNIYGDDIRDMANQIRMFQAERPSCKKNTIHLALSFNPGEVIPPILAEKVIKSFLKEMGVKMDVHMYAVVQHFNTQNQHYHIILSRIGIDKSLFSDSFLKIKLNVACDKIEKLYNLDKVKNRRFISDQTEEKGYKFIQNKKVEKSLSTSLAKHSKTNLNEKIKFIHEHLNRVLAFAKTTTEIEAYLLNKRIKAIFLTNSGGIFGVKFSVDSFSIKGSEIGFKWLKIKSILDSNINKQPSQNGTQAIEIAKPLNFLTSIQNNEKQQKETKPIQHHNLEIEPFVRVTYPQPTEFELQEIKDIDLFSKTLFQILSECYHEALKGNINCLHQVLQNNKFEIRNDKAFYYHKSGYRTSLGLKYFEAIKNEVYDNYNTFNRQSEEYNNLIHKQSLKISFWDSREIQEDKKRENSKLEKAKSLAIKPVLNIFDLNENFKKFKIHPSYIIKKAKHESEQNQREQAYKISKIKARIALIDNSEDEDFEQNERKYRMKM